MCNVQHNVVDLFAEEINVTGDGSARFSANFTCKIAWTKNNRWCSGDVQTEHVGYLKGIMIVSIKMIYGPGEKHREVQNKS